MIKHFDRHALLLFVKASLACHTFYDGIVNKGLARNPWFPHELEDRRDCFGFNAGDPVEIGYRVAVMFLDALCVSLARIFGDHFKRCLFLAMQGGHPCGV